MSSNRQRVRFSRGDKIRTCDLLVPNQALYQAEPHPVSFEGQSQKVLSHVVERSYQSNKAATTRQGKLTDSSDRNRLVSSAKSYVKPCNCYRQSCRIFVRPVASFGPIDLARCHQHAIFRPLFSGAVPTAAWHFSSKAAGNE